VDDRLHRHCRILLVRVDEYNDVMHVTGTGGRRAPEELRVGLGCMRLSTDEDRDEQRALDTITAAVEAGITLFDTARAYGHGERELGHNERLLARALRSCGGDATARIVTKGGMSRPGAAWLPDGRAKTIRADCEASLEALGGLSIDLYLVHAPDPRTPWPTTVRALARLVDDRLVRRVGVANVSRPQLDHALVHAPVAAVQVALSPFDDRALRGGVLERCVEAGVELIAHSPLGGPKRKRALARHPQLGDVARAHDATPAEIALAWLLTLAPGLVVIPGARTPDAARSARRAADVELDGADRRLLSRAFGTRPRAAARTPSGSAAEVVLVMGIPGAGKTRTAAEYVERGFARLNRDERGGSLRDLAEALDERLASGARRVVLDNTYLTRASRSHVLEVAARHGAKVECVWADATLAQAQLNLVERLLDRLGHLPRPEELRALARTEPGVLAPTSQMRALRELEPPSEEEGFARIRQIPFERAPVEKRRRPGLFVARAVLRGESWQGALPAVASGTPVLLFDWSPDGREHDLEPDGARLAAALGVPVETALCPHGGGPPRCWCRPPLPGLLVAFARAEGVDPAASALVGTSPAHRTLAETLGARFVAP
jgi:aryl-alcohol dehydrogenase-like predicted oxidoreductase/predicted kinase